jgi:hypothetical protein
VAGGVDRGRQASPVPGRDRGWAGRPAGEGRRPAGGGRAGPGEPGADLIANCLSPDRHPAGRTWSRKLAEAQRRLCQRYLLPVIGGVACEDIKISHMQAAVNAAPTAGEGDRVRRCVSALIGAGLAGGYLVNPRLVQMHWQPGERQMPEAMSAIAGKRRLCPLPI